MRGISITALVISNLAYWAIFVLAAMIVAIAGGFVAMIANGDAVHEAFEALKASQAFDLIILNVSYPAAAVGGGYVAARLNRARPQLQSVLALITSTMLYFSDLGHVQTPHGGADLDAPTVSTFATVNLFLGPVLAILGAHLAQRRQARLDAMSTEERDARTLTAAAVAAVRWLLAFPAAIAAFFIVAAPTLGMPVFFGTWVLMFAVVVAILVATWTAPPTQRRFAGFLFIALTLLVPAEEIARHAWFGTLTHTHTLVMLMDTAAAGFAYVWMRKAFPRSFANDPGRWWWALDLDLAQWSSEERIARRGLAVTAVLTWFALLALIWALLGPGRDFAFVVSLAAVATLPIALLAARPAFARMAPDLLWRADQNAAVRHGTRSATPAE